MADLATLQARLIEAETALHKLSTGSMTEEITSPDGGRIRYMLADISKLNAYVASLAAQVTAASTASASTMPKRAPVFINPFNYES